MFLYSVYMSIKHVCIFKNIYAFIYIYTHINVKTQKHITHTYITAYTYTCKKANVNVYINAQCINVKHIQMFIYIHMCI